MLRVLVSYAFSSKQHVADVEVLTRLLGDVGVEVDNGEFRLGGSEGWAQWLVRELPHCDCVLLVVSPEMNHVPELDLLPPDRVYPVVLPGDPPVDLSEPFWHQKPHSLAALDLNSVEHLAKALVHRFGRPDEPTARQVVPGFAGEVARGRDLLGIEDDAVALAGLVASARLQPPLAIALYGPWGSGKTFFMRTLRDHVARLTSVDDPAFCRSVRTVWFDAWHYAEGNLWASLVHHIFSSLRGDPSGAHQRALDEALAHVRGVRDARQEAERQADATRNRAEHARDELRQVQDEYRVVRERAAETSVRDVWAAVRVDEDLRRQFDQAVDALGLPAVGDSARQLAQAAGEVRAVVRRGRSLATAGPWWRSPLALGVVVTLVVLTGGLLLSALVDWRQGWLGPVIAVAGQVVAVVSGAAGWLTRQAAVARRVLAPAERVQRQVDERLAEVAARFQAERARIEQGLAEAQTDLAAARARLAEAEAEQVQAQDELDQLTGARLLERYLSERVGSGDYGRYLGVVALAHRDLRDLDDYLRAIAAEPAGRAERIVLYIDDLDRCDAGTVVRVLEAVNLLLALPLFVVVLGVDARWLARSLWERHPLLLAAREGYPAIAGPEDYLDKIFQLSYRLPAMTADGCAGLLEHTALLDQPATPVTRLSTPAPVGEPATGPVPVSTGTASPTATTAAALVLDEGERQTLRHVAPLVGSSPRRAKRFLNVYRVTKARALADASLATRLTDPSSRDTDTAGLLLLTALVIGLPQWSVTALAVLPEAPSVRELLSGVAEPEETDRARMFANTGGALLDRPGRDLVPWLSVVLRFAGPALTP